MSNYFGCRTCITCFLIFTIPMGCDGQSSDEERRSSPVLGMQLERSAGNPLRTEEGSNLIDHDMISDPCVLFEDGRYRMWFTTLIKPYTDDQELGIGYAESDDGLIWKSHIDTDTREPLLVLRPTTGEWDAEGVETASVVRTPDGRYLMYYSGDRSPKGTNSWAIGLAVSEDGITWKKYGNEPVFEGKGGWEGPFLDDETGQLVGGVQEPSVLYDSEDKVLKMWYSALGEKDGKLAFRVGYATSSDGVWWKRNAEPVLEPGIEGTWDDRVVSHIGVTKDLDNVYHLFYFGTSGTKWQEAEDLGASMIKGFIGYAFSEDGISWEKRVEPVLKPVSDTWESWTVGGPCPVTMNEMILLWYFGSAAHDTFQNHFGHAIVELPNR